jgi:acetyl/propionyl-CoA carboxylase alpha subunit
MRFNSILVANRGEIACRIMQTAQFMGIKCIAVFVEADKDAPFVKMADEAIKLSSSYMDDSAIIDAANNLEQKQSIQDMDFYLKMLLLLEKLKVIN